MKHGFLMLDRILFRHWLWQEERTYSRAEAWIDLLAMAAYARRDQMIGGSLIRLEVGELIASVRFLAERWKWGKDRVNRFLGQLEGAHLIERKTRQGQTVVRVEPSMDCIPQHDSLRDNQATDAGPPTRQPSDKLEDGKREVKNREKGEEPAWTRNRDVDAMGPVAQAVESLVDPAWEEHTELKLKRTLVSVDSKLLLKLGEAVGRSRSHRWSALELCRLHELDPPLDEIELITRYYAAILDFDIRCQDLLGLLTNWIVQLDRARSWDVEEGDIQF